MASPLKNDVIRRIKLSTDKYKMIEVSLLTGETEMFEVSARNRAQDPVEYQISIDQLLRYICPDLYEEQEETEKEEVQEEVVEEPVQEEKYSQEEPDPCWAIRKKSTKNMSYDEWVEDLFKWRKQKTKQKMVRK